MNRPTPMLDTALSAMLLILLGSSAVVLMAGAFVFGFAVGKVIFLLLSWIMLA